MSSSETIRRLTDLPALPLRPCDAHKGSFGRVLIVAGSRGMSGAACLAGLGALRGGAGLVDVAAAEGVAPVIAAAEPSYLTIPLAEDDAGRICFDALSKIETAVGNSTAVAVGPGCGQSEDLDRLICELFTQVDKPMVVDADALNALAKTPDVLSRGPAARILTPHPGEFARLTGTDVTTIQQNREETAARFARDHNVILVLKGQGTVITDGRQLAVNSTGNSGMATGGAGDVLTGLIAALLAQGLSAFAAAQLGVHLHGLAGDLAAEELSQPGLIASDLPRYLAAAWNTLATIRK